MMYSSEFIINCITWFILMNLDAPTFKDMAKMPMIKTDLCGVSPLFPQMIVMSTSEVPSPETTHCLFPVAQHDSKKSKLPTVLNVHYHS